MTNAQLAPAESGRYDAVAQLFHWTVVALVVLQYATKWVPVGFASLTERQLNA